MRRVLIDQGNTVEVIYPDLYKGLNLKPEDLTAYDSLLVSFEGKTVTPRGQIRLPIQTGSDVMEVDFIVVDAYSPYMAIVARPWLHTLGAISSTLYQKVKYPSEGQVKEITGDQTMARQCMVARNGNESGSGRVFLYPDPTREARPVAWTRPFLGIRPESTRALFIFDQDKTLIGL